MKFSTVKFCRQACDAFRACRTSEFESVELLDSTCNYSNAASPDGYTRLYRCPSFVSGPAQHFVVCNMWSFGVNGITALAVVGSLFAVAAIE